MSEAKPTIAALRTWLKTCPLIAEEQDATGAAFRIAGLEGGAGCGAEPDRRGIRPAGKDAHLLHGGGCLGQPGAAAAALAYGREMTA